MRAVQISRFGEPEVLEIIDIPEPVPGPGQKLFDVSTAGVKFADTHHARASLLIRRFQVATRLYLDPSATG